MSQAQLSWSTEGFRPVGKVDDPRMCHPLDGFQWNIGQIVGPVAGGFLLAAVGAGGMFAVAAALMTAIVGFLFVWRGRQTSRLSTPGEGASENTRCRGPSGHRRGDGTRCAPSSGGDGRWAAER